MKKKSPHAIFNVLGGVAGILIVGAVLTFAFEAFAFVGPTQAPPSGSGAIGSDASNNVSIGTSATISGTKLVVVGASNDSSTNAAQFLENNTTPIFILNDDGSVSIETSTVSAGNTVIGGNLTVGGTFTASGLSGSIVAGNISGGVFSSNLTPSNFAFPVSLGVNTSTQVGLPQPLSVYGGGYFSGSVGIGTASPGATLDVHGSTNFTGTSTFSGTVGILTASDPLVLLKVSVNGAGGINTGSTMKGINSQPINNGLGAIIGLYSQPLNNVSSGSAGDLTAIQTSERTVAAAITNAYGVLASSPALGVSSTITNAYGINIGQQKLTGVTNGYGIYQTSASDTNYFAGWVGINKVAPAYALDVSGVINSNSYAQATGFYVSNTGQGINNVSTTGLAFRTNSVDDRMVIDNTGKVGIGTTTPSFPLTVNGTTSALAYCISGANCITSWPSGGGVTSVFGRTGTVVASSGDYSVGQVTGAAPLASPTFTGTISFPGSGIWNSSGNVGIMTTAPQAALNVGAGAGGIDITPGVSAGGYNSALGFNVFWNGSSWATNGDGSSNGGSVITTNWGSGSINFSSFANTAGTGKTVALNNLMTILPSGYVGIGTTTPTYNLTVNGTGDFTGKLTANTIDPLYTIGGTNYSTYVPGMTGEKEETAGMVNLQKGSDGTYSATMDFATEPKGSDLWLFAQATNVAHMMNQLIVTLTPSFDGNVWYTKNASTDTLVLHGSVAGEVSYNLTAPRFDAAQWPNLAPANESSTTGLIINNQ